MGKKERSFRVELSKRSVAIPLSGIRVVFEKAQKMTGLVRLELGEPDFPTPAHIREAAKKALDDGFTHYMSSQGLLELRKELATKLEKENGVYASPDTEIIVTAGACCAVDLAMLTLVNPGDEVLLPDPAWPHYEPCARLADGSVVHYPMREEANFTPDPDAIRKKITAKTKVLLINSPNNPTGSVISASTLKEIANLAEQHNLVVISDEVYEKLVYDGTSHQSFAAISGMRDRTITINAFSKTYAMTGWRLGYAVAPANIVAEMAKLNLYANTCANSIAQVAGIAALRGPQDCVREMAEEYARRRRFVLEQLRKIPEISCTEPKGAFYVFPNIRKLGMNSLDCCMHILEKGKVSTVPGSSFGQQGEGYLRISYATSIENLREGFRRLETVIDQPRDLPGSNSIGGTMR
jgi:aspartate/methionine/tyrosine aminotransferase